MQPNNNRIQNTFSDSHYQTETYQIEKYQDERIKSGKRMGGSVSQNETSRFGTGVVGVLNFHTIPNPHKTLHLFIRLKVRGSKALRRKGW